MLRYKINIPTLLRLVFITIVFLSSLVSAQIIRTNVVLAAPPVCYAASGSRSSIQESECASAGGSQQSSRSYRDTAGVTIGGPVDDKCYLVTSDAGSLHIIYTEQTDCESLSSAATSSSGLVNDCNDDELSKSNCGIIKYLVLFINVLSSLAGIIIVGSIIYAGIQYSASGNDPQKISAAKERIRNAIIALLFFIFGYGLLNYLIPGGVL